MKNGLSICDKLMITVHTGKKIISEGAFNSISTCIFTRFFFDASIILKTVESFLQDKVAQI